MKILHVYKDFYPPIKGGIEGHINLLATGQIRRGCQCEVLVASRDHHLQKGRFDGISVTLAPQLGRISSAPLTPNFSLWLQRLGTWADVIHFHFPNPTAEMALLATRLKRKIVVSYHSDIVRQAVLKIFYQPFMHRFLRRVDRIFVATPNYLNSSKVLQPYRKKCRIVPYGIDLGRFAQNADRKARVASIRKQYGSRLALFAGRFRYYKGIFILLEAMRHVNAKALIVGAGPMETELREQAERNGAADRIVFLGELSDQALSDHMHACDLFVLPSIARSEAFGIVQLEAMACGKPVICTELNSGTSYVNAHMQTGLVVPPKNPEALAAAMTVLFEDPYLMAQMGAASRKRVESIFQADQMIDAILANYPQGQGR